MNVASSVVDDRLKNEERFASARRLRAPFARQAVVRYWQLFSDCRPMSMADEYPSGAPRSPA
ncbi:protein of unknown function [Paraburkholderia kururiensis]